MERLSTANALTQRLMTLLVLQSHRVCSAEIRGTNQAIRNAMDGQAMLDTAEGARDRSSEIRTHC